MPLPMQAKLLRVLETGEVQRVGGTTRHTMNVRIIAATNRDLYAMAENGLFRMDLYYRLHVVPVIIPPLRDRPEDIHTLTARFLADCNRRYNQHKYFTPQALDMLTTYRWPGNVRELRNFVERLAMVTPASAITPELCSALLTPALTSTPSPRRPGAPVSLREFRRQAEADHIRDTLAACGGNVYKAADMLKIHKTALYRKLHALGIRP